jgi:hypothetical protein
MHPTGVGIGRSPAPRRGNFVGCTSDFSELMRKKGENVRKLAIRPIRLTRRLRIFGRFTKKLRLDRPLDEHIK